MTDAMIERELLAMLAKVEREQGPRATMTATLGALSDWLGIDCADVSRCLSRLAAKRVTHWSGAQSRMWDMRIPIQPDEAHRGQSVTIQLSAHVACASDILDGTADHEVPE
jgi:hypothetical protein